MGYFNKQVPDSVKSAAKSIKDEKKRLAKEKELCDEYLNKLNTMNWVDRPVTGDASEAAIIKFF